LSCSQCKAAMVLQIPAASVVFKGEGWAKKDRRGKV
jgi:predicted nucleic acid-binding Zn ribbon protein